MKENGWMDEAYPRCLGREVGHTSFPSIIDWRLLELPVNLPIRVVELWDEAGVSGEN